MSTTTLLAWSTLRKRANSAGHCVRQTTIDGAKTPVFLLLDSNKNVKLATRSQSSIQDAVCSL